MMQTAETAMMRAAELDRLHATHPAELDAAERGAGFGQAVISCS
jgi:hypothetical protein